MAIEVKHYKVKQLPSSPTPNSIYWVKANTDSEVSGYITDLQGVPYPLKDISGSGGITNITNTDGNLVITGADNKVINLAPALLSVINSALQSGANISELVNDAGYITSSSLPVNTSDLTNDGEDGINPFITLQDLPNISTLLREEFVFSGSQTFTLANNYAQVYSIEVQGQGALSTSQYNLIAPNQITINDALDSGDYIVIIYSDASAGVVPYYTQGQTDSLILANSVSNKYIKNETPLGAIDGINAIFTTQFSLEANSEDVFVNGQKQIKPSDYNIFVQTITFTFSPNIDEIITINYIKQ